MLSQRCARSTTWQAPQRLVKCVCYRHWLDPVSSQQSSTPTGLKSALLARICRPRAQRRPVDSKHGAGETPSGGRLGPLPPPPDRSWIARRPGLERYSIGGILFGWGRPKLPPPRVLAGSEIGHALNSQAVGKSRGRMFVASLYRLGLCRRDPCPPHLALQADAATASSDNVTAAGEGPTVGVAPAAGKEAPASGGMVGLGGLWLSAEREASTGVKHWSGWSLTWGCRTLL